jgi:hypothetical protein
LFSLLNIEVQSESLKRFQYLLTKSFQLYDDPSDQQHTSQPFDANWAKKATEVMEAAVSVVVPVNAGKS